ncbi:MAG TPA: hypothetical protein VK928_01485 [Longimicrobiales bacterium]|nr:hypothetical protein [Longimicrobiales bacterium]
MKGPALSFPEARAARTAQRHMQSDDKEVIMPAISETSPTDATAPDPPMLAFLPLHKAAFGLGMGVAGGLFVFMITIIHVARSADPYPLSLLDRFFYGYSVSVPGAFAGLFWAAFAGFTGGWFFAFCRNLAIAVSTFVVRTRAELRQMRDFLDHI